MQFCEAIAVPTKGRCPKPPRTSGLELQISSRYYERTKSVLLELSERAGTHLVQLDLWLWYSFQLPAAEKGSVFDRSSLYSRRGLHKSMNPRRWGSLGATLEVWLPQGITWPESHVSDCLKSQFLGLFHFPSFFCDISSQVKAQGSRCLPLCVQIPKWSYITKSGFWEMLCYKSCWDGKKNRNYQKEETARRPVGARWAT